MTKTERLINALQVLGYQEGACDHPEYRAFKCKHINNYFMFVGKGGTLRHGSNVVGSVPVSGVNKDTIIQKAYDKEAGK